MAERKGRRKGGKKYSPPTSEASFKVTANCIQVTDGDVSSLNIVTGTLNEKMRGGREESDTGFEGEITSTEKHTTLDYSKVRGIQRPTSGISGYDVTLKRIVTVAQIAPSQIVAVSKTFKFNGDGKKTLTTDILNEMNSEGTTEMQLKQQMIFYKDQLDNKREPKTTDAKQNEPSAKSVNPPEELESPPNESGNSPAEPDPPPTDSPKEPGLTSTDSGTDCVNKLGDSDTKDNLRKSSGNADNVPAETESSNEPTISHDPPSTQGSSAGAGCPNEQGNSSDPSSTQDTSTTGTPSYQSTPSSKTDKHSDVTSDQTENSQTLRTSHDLPSKDSTAKTKDSHFNQNHKKRMKTQQETPSQAPRKRSCRSRNKRDAIKNRNLKKNEGKNHFPKQPPSHDVTCTSYDTDEQLVHQQTLDLASRKKKPLQRRRRGTATKGEESWPNSDDSESKRDATDCYESTRSRVKSKRPNSIKRHRTRAPQSGDGGGAPRDPEQSTQSCDSDSVSEDKSWTRPTQETDPATSTEMVYPRPRPLPLTNEGQLNLYVSSHEPPRLEEMMASSVQVFAEPLHDSSTTSQLVSPPSCVPVSLQPPSLYWFRINVIRGRSCGDWQYACSSKPLSYMHCYSTAYSIPPSGSR
ncbi:proteoglycan 4-like isoform X2 [Halichondria panicea]|uniref:proteoglycan 4-like isoform X2 n=1 Tax=Halichondria panicea TaxID=6063 RepID=UPI00312BB27E